MINGAVLVWKRIVDHQDGRGCPLTAVVSDSSVSSPSGLATMRPLLLCLHINPPLNERCDVPRVLSCYVSAEIRHRCI